MKKKLILLFHGYGDSSNLFENLITKFSDLLRNNFTLIALNGIEQYELDTTSNTARQWFSLLSLDPSVIIEKIEQNLPAIFAIIKKHQKEHNVDNSETVLLGFSQGAILCTYLTLTENYLPYLATVCFSGANVPLKRINNSITPFLLIHGKLDNVIDLSLSDDQVKFFEKNNIRYKRYVYDNLNHRISHNGILQASDFLLKI